MEIVSDKKFEKMFDELENDSEYKAELDCLAFTEKIVGIMDRKGITRASLARKMGCTPAYVTRLLRGTVNFTMLTMRKIADAIGCNINYDLSVCDQKEVASERGWMEDESKRRRIVIGAHGIGIKCEWFGIDSSQKTNGIVKSNRKEHENDQFSSAA